MGELKAKGVDLYLHQQSLDTSTPAGKAMFQMLGVFSEFEREIIRERVNSGLARAKAQGKTLGRPRLDTAKRLAAIRKLRQQGVGINKIARTLGIGVSVVQRIVSGSSRLRSSCRAPTAGISRSKRRLPASSYCRPARADV